MTRKEANLEIAKILKRSIFETDYNLGSIFTTLAIEYPQQRAGQIVCNYICPDYRWEPSKDSQRIMLSLFNIKYDPFFEESTETLERLQKPFIGCMVYFKGDNDNCQIGYVDSIEETIDEDNTYYVKINDNIIPLKENEVTALR